MQVKLIPLPREWRERGWINCRKYIIDLTSCSTYRHFSSTCKWYLVCKRWFCWGIIKKCKLNIILLGNNLLGNIFADVITIKTLFTSVIADCRGEFRGLLEQLICYQIIFPILKSFYCKNYWKIKRLLVETGMIRNYLFPRNRNSKI